MHVGEAEEMRGTLAGLHVLERDVVDRLAAGKGVVQVFEHLLRRRADVDLQCRDAERTHQVPGGLPRLRRCRKARHRDRQHVTTRQRQLIEGACRHQQGLGRIEPSGYADDGTLEAGRLQPLGEALHLDAVDFPAALASGRGLGRHVGEAVDDAPERHRRRRRRSFEGKLAHACKPRPVRIRAIAEARQAHALLPQAVQVDVG
jgi:hypothetical protein